MLVHLQNGNKQGERVKTKRPEHKKKCFTLVIEDMIDFHEKLKVACQCDLVTGLNPSEVNNT